MAYSQIEDKYLSALTAVQFPDAPMDEAAAPQEMAPGQQPGDILLAGSPVNMSGQTGFRNLPTQPGGGQGDTIKSFDPTVRQKLSDFLQSGFEGMGVDRYKARQNAQTIVGGGSSNLPLNIGLADIVPFLGTALQTEESAILAGESKASLERGDYGTAAMQYGGAALGMLPGAAATMKVAGALPKNLPIGLGTEAVGGMQDVLQTPAIQVLNRQERAVISAGAGRKKGRKEEATNLATNMKSNYPEADGWSPIEINKVEQKFDKAGNYVKVEVEPKAISYDFNTPPEGVPLEAWQATLSSRVMDEVQIVVDRAAAGDQAALDILAEASWYRTMRDRLRTEFGGLGDVFADILGTTSAQTDVRQNFKNAITILTKFSRGEYDNTLAAYESRVAKGQPVDAKTLTDLDKAGQFDLIKSDAGKLFNTNSPASMGALLDMFRAIKAGDSPKTPNFTGNLIGLTSEATIDVWAARMLRRLAELPRIPPPAEQGVVGAHMKGSTLFDPKVSGEFGFGQDVFREAADEINKSGMIKNIAPDIGDLGPDDLQAVAWFIEKEGWSKNGWTTKAGEGGSLDYEMSLAGSPGQAKIGELRQGINAGFQPPAMRVGEKREMRDLLPGDPNFSGPPLPPFVGPLTYPSRVDQARQIDIANKIDMRKELASMKAPLERYQLGISGERPNKPMSNYAQAELAAEHDDVLRNNPSVVSYNLSNTYGSFMGQTERALNAEFVVRQDFDPAPLERRMIEQGKAYDQDAVFISKVVKDGAGENSRPGVEIYFKQKISPDQMAAVTAKLREYGVDGFTYVTDMRFNDRVNVQAKAGGAETAGLNGLRFQYIPEFDDAYTVANRTQIMAEKQSLFRKVVNDIIKEGNVSDARLVHYDTKVYFRSDYDAYLARATGNGNQGERGASPVGANAAQPDNSGKVGKDFSRAVSDRLRKKATGSKTPTVKRGDSAPTPGAE